MELQAGLLLITIFFVLLVTSVPISISIVLSALGTMVFFLTPKFGILIAAQKLATGMDSFTLIAVPFFILAGAFMGNGGIAKRLVDFGLALLGKIPGSLAHTNIAGNAMFGSISGSGIAAAAAIGGVMGPLEKEAGYDEGFSAAVNVATAPVGQLIPPTAAFIIYSLASGGASVGVLFMAGWIPGLLWCFLCMILAYFIAKKNKYEIVDAKFDLKVIGKAFIAAVPSLFLIVIVIGGIVKGLFTPTEASGIAVAYTFILSVIVYKSIKLSEIPKILSEAAVMTTTVMLIIGASSVLSFVMSFTGLPTAISNIILGISDNKIILLLIINLFLLIVGTFMDMAPALLIFTPILLPIATTLGMDTIHFGVMIVMNLAVGTITPPVGNVLFVGCSVANLEIEDVLKKLLPFYGVIIIALLMVTFIPQLSLWLPTALGMLD
ncbi:TRAP transporter large permease [Clostridium lacusfryxellense]|uniref:TRAP transporter large permease n=1 Tax=Clostridium lacusfryxellense TaxID=205328 RepID=UPI001C0A9A9D|nr:TRAP transporter large permease [Clostridium lacusfryxellense]MBU3114052.1 TRAP transporter large permease [Clostridium lacusfryxellense]